MISLGFFYIEKLIFIRGVKYEDAKFFVSRKARKGAKTQRQQTLTHSREDTKFLLQNKDAN
jgi:hypothetical protein